MGGWEVKPIGEVCTIKPPKAEARAKLADGDEVSFAPMEDLGIGVKYMAPRQTRHLSAVSGSYTYFADGDVLLAKITPCFENGKLGVARGLANGVGFGSSEYIVLRPGSTLDAEFLYYYLARPTFTEEGARTMTGAVGHKRVAKEFIENYPIPLPPLAEQQRIVAILDEAFEAIATAKANAEKNLQNARELFGSHLQSVFLERDNEWKLKSLGEMATFRNGINFSKSSKGSPIKILGVKDFKDHYWAPLDNLESIIPDGVIPDGDTLQKNDIVFVRSNGNPELIGRCVLTGEVNERTTHSGFTIKTRLQTSEVLPAYVCHFLKSNRVRKEMVAGGNGANIKSLNQGSLSRIVVPFPSVARQLQIVQRLEEIKGEALCLTDIHHQKLTALDELKKSLLHQAFTGQL